MSVSAGETHLVDVVVIGAGQAGLSAGYHLRRRGFLPSEPQDLQNLLPEEDARGHHQSFVILDAEVGPGGAWRHRWASLRMATVNGIYELPGFPMPEGDPDEPSRDAVPAYFGAFEARHDLAVRRPVKVRAVHRQRAQAAQDAQVSQGRLCRFLVETDSGTWSAKFVINATGTWTRPFWPHYPGRERFRGCQLHVRDYVAAEDFAGQRVAIVGAGISATQLLDEISRVAETLWFTRREPDWIDEPTAQDLIESLAVVEENTRQGRPGTSVIRVTGMYRAPWIERADTRGVLIRHPMFKAIEERGLRMADGSFEPVDTILWATGFHPEISHLSPLKLRTEHGGIRVAKGRALDAPGLFLIGYGPSQSTIGANRAGRDVVRVIANSKLL